MTPPNPGFVLVNEEIFITAPPSGRPSSCPGQSVHIRSTSIRAESIPRHTIRSSPRPLPKKGGGGVVGQTEDAAVKQVNMQIMPLYDAIVMTSVFYFNHIQYCSNQ